MTNDTTWTPGLVESALREALVTLRRIPSKHLFPAGIRSAMPEVVRSIHEAYGWDSISKPRVQATSEDIRAMDEALGWIWSWCNTEACRRAGLVEDTSNILLMRAAGLTYDKVSQWRIERWAAPKAKRSGGRGVIPGGNSHKMIRASYTAGIAHIVRQLGGDDTPAKRPEHERDDEWGVQVAVAMPGEILGVSEHSGQPIHASARWQMTRKPGR